MTLSAVCIALRAARVRASLDEWQGETWIHYSKMPKIGINPRQFHRDPAAIYLFPERFQPVGNWSRYPYKYTVKLKPGLRVLDLSKLNVAEAKQLVADALAAVGEEPRGAIDRIHDVDGAWDVLQTTLKPGQFNKALRSLGYDAVFDDTGSIHSAEVQLAVLDPRFIVVVNREDPSKKGTFLTLTELLQFLSKEMSRYGKVTVTEPKRTRQSGWGRVDYQAEARIEVVAEGRSVSFRVRTVDTDGRKPVIHLSLSWSEPQLNYGVGAEFDVATGKWDRLESVFRSLDTIFTENTLTARARKPR